MRKIIIGIFLALSFCSAHSFAEDTKFISVEETHLQKNELAGQRINLKGTIVKVNNGIMGKNFLHLRDGTGGEGTNDLTITSQETAEVDDVVEINGLVTVNRDFGFGYNYPLLIEEAKIKSAQ